MQTELKSNTKHDLFWNSLKFITIISFYFFLIVFSMSISLIIFNENYWPFSIPTFIFFSLEIFVLYSCFILMVNVTITFSIKLFKKIYNKFNKEYYAIYKNNLYTIEDLPGLYKKQRRDFHSSIFIIHIIAWISFIAILSFTVIFITGMLVSLLFLIIYEEDYIPIFFKQLFDWLSFLLPFFIIGPFLEFIIHLIKKIDPNTTFEKFSEDILKTQEKELEELKKNNIENENIIKHEI